MGAKEKLDISLLVYNDEITFSDLTDRLYTLRIKSGVCVPDMSDMPGAIELYSDTTAFISAILCKPSSSAITNPKVCELGDESWMKQWSFLDQADVDLFFEYIARRKETLSILELAFLDPTGAGTPYPSISDAADIALFSEI
eukprot:GDKK01026304.1.p1 GENE.GDKK01026304.1~~GDKK01026304.1.p1  ORF type:complete len:142 (-),score=10.83 GDKK01026304.1:5-430(-)